MLNTYSRTLSCGTLKVTPTGGTIALDELFDVAEGATLNARFCSSARCWAAIFR